MSGVERRVPIPTVRRGVYLRRQTGLTEIAKASTGPIVLAFLGHGNLDPERPDGLVRALDALLRPVRCSALLARDQVDAACRWLQEEVAARRRVGERPRIAVLGYGFGGSAACLFVDRWQDEEGAGVDLLVTIDALKSGQLGLASGATASLLTLDQRLLGGKGAPIAFARGPRQGRAAAARHINYYQRSGSWLRGAAMAEATENYEVQRNGAGCVDHGLLDNLVMPLVIGDLRWLFAEATP